MTAAQGKLLHRYRTAIYRYVFAFVRERESSEDICQEFAVRFVRGDFRNADPARGRFRDLVKTAVYNLMIDDNRSWERAASSERITCFVKVRVED